MRIIRARLARVARHQRAIALTLPLLPPFSRPRVEARFLERYMVISSGPGGVGSSEPPQVAEDDAAREPSRQKRGGGGEKQDEDEALGPDGEVPEHGLHLLAPSGRAPLPQ